jgi:hypothetical protein
MAAATRTTLLALALLAAAAPGSAPAATSSPVAPLIEGRRDFTTTVLPSGKVLVAGGVGGGAGAVTKSCELFDPATGRWTAADSLRQFRFRHTATLLPNGLVLVVGGVGSDFTTELGTAELYDPIADRWSDAAPPLQPRASHTATLLASGKVLVAGGLTLGASLQTAEVYDPVGGGWSSVTPMAELRWLHTATLLADGRVLVVGGLRMPADTVGLGTAEVWDPGLDSWSPTLPLTSGRAIHTATLLTDGRVLVAGTAGAGGDTAELFNPASNGWASAGGPMWCAREGHAAVLLASGRVLLAGGLAGPAWEIYDPLTNSFERDPGVASGVPRYAVGGALLRTGEAIFTGGYTPGAPTTYYTATTVVEPGALGVTAAPSLVAARFGATLLPLPDGGALLVGGTTGAAGPLASAERYDPTGGTSTWLAVPPMATGRSAFAAVRLQSGHLLVSGGDDGSGSIASCELFDPQTNTWKATGAMTAARAGHSAVVLADGRVLAAGGILGGSILASAEIYDPATATWAATGPMATARLQFSALALADGRVFAVGGMTGGGVAGDAERFDPVSGTWTAVASPGVARARAAATLLPNGTVLVTGGYAPLAGGPTASAELFDPASGVWIPLSPMNAPRELLVAGLLPTGEVFVMGGGETTFSPTTGRWSSETALMPSVSAAAGLLLPDGRFLVAGGTSGTPSTAAGTYRLQRSDLAVAGPKLDPLAATLHRGLVVTLTGSRLRSTSPGGSGNASSSPIGPPLVQLRRADGRQDWLAATSSTATEVTFTLPSDVPAGRSWIAVAAGGALSPAVPADLPGATIPGAPGTTAPPPPAPGSESPFSCGHAAGAPALLALGALLAALRRRRGRALLVALLLAAPLAGEAAPAGAPSAAARRAAARGRIAVMPLKVGKGVQPQLAEMVTDAFVAALYERGVPTITMSDVEAALGFERQKQLLGCADEKSCLAEIAGALGTDRIVSGSLTRVEAVTALRLQLFDSRGAVVEKRFYEAFQDAKAGQLLDAARRAAGTLFADWKGVAAVPAPPVLEQPPPAVAKEAPEPARRAPAPAEPPPPDDAGGAPARGPSRLAVGTLARYDPADPGGIAAVLLEWRAGNGLRLGAGPVLTGARSAGLTARAAWTPLSGRLQPFVALEALAVWNPSLLSFAGGGVGVEWALSPRLLLAAEVPFLRILSGPAKFKSNYLLPGFSLRWLL